MSASARRVLLPKLVLSVASDEPCVGSEEIVLKSKDEKLTYHRTPVRIPGEKRSDGGPEWSLGRYARFPIVLNADGSPWAEANLYLIDLAEIKTEPNMLSLGTVAEDIGAYRNFLDVEELDWLTFPVRKFARPTYRYSAELKHQIRTGKMSPGVAKRRMATVIRFYGWLMRNELIAPQNPPWVERGVAIAFQDDIGREHIKAVTTTDVSISTPAAEDPWDERITDGGKLRPLITLEQDAILHVLAELRNVEMTLIHQLALLTGAREQTVLTFRLAHVATPPDQIIGEDVRIRCGPGTGIDTKKNKKGTLHIPKYLYEKLHVYSLSPRAAARRKKNDIGENPSQYLFLTQHGKPFYESIEDRHKIKSAGKQLKGTKQGQSLRTFITRRIIPKVRARLNRLDFSYRFHDLRASFGMNFVDFNVKRIAVGGAEREKVIRQLAGLLWHSNLETTVRYLDFRYHMKMTDAANEGWSTYLRELIQRSAGSNA